MSPRARLPVRALVRLAAITPVLASLTLVGSATKLGPSVAGCAQAATVHHAALIVEHSAGSGHGAGPVIKACVSFTEDSITGDQLLTRSGVEFGRDDSGQAVCQIDSEPTMYQPHCLTANKPYWAMYVSRGGGSWTYSSLGFTTQVFRDGDAEGFRFEGQSDGTAPPSPSGVCPVSTSPTPAATRAATPAPARTAVAPSAAASVTGAATAGVTTPPATAAASSSPSPAPSTSATAHAAASIVGRSTPPGKVSAGVWVAGGLGGVLLAGLALQLTRAGRRSPQRPPP
jgi:hypothetical protein